MQRLLLAALIAFAPIKGVRAETPPFHAPQISELAPVPGGAGPLVIAGGSGNGFGGRAARVADLRNSEGVNVNLGWDNGGRDASPPYADPYTERASCAWAGNSPDCGSKAVADMLGFLGIRHVRNDGIGQDERMREISRRAPGVTWDMVAEILGYQGSKTALAEYIETAAGLSNLIEAIEGTNEPDNAAFNLGAAYGGSSDRAQQTKAWQRDLWNAAKASRSTAATPVFGPSLTPFCTGMRSLGQLRGYLHYGCYERFANLAPYANFANTHAYMSSDYISHSSLSGDGTSYFVEYGAYEARMYQPPRPVVNTESGVPQNPYYGGWGCCGGVDEATAARFDTAMIFDAMRDSIRRSYFFELVARFNGSDPATDGPEPYFGLFNSDFTPKLAAIAIHNLNTVLTDAGPAALIFTTGTLDYTVHELPKTSYSVLFQKTSGVFDIVLNNEPFGVWTGARHKGERGYRNDIPATAVTVLFGRTFPQVAVYDPVTDADGRSAAPCKTLCVPIASAHNASSIVVRVTDHPIIVELGG